MLDFHVTKDIFKDVKDKKKYHEYRELKPYWDKRFNGVKTPCRGRIFQGYTNHIIEITILSINIIKREDIQNEKYRSFIHTQLCYNIEYKLGWD